MRILTPEVTVGYHLEGKKKPVQIREILFPSWLCWTDIWWATSFECVPHCCYMTCSCFIHSLSFLSLKDFLPPTVSPLACFAFEAGFHSLKLDLMLVLNSSESHSGLDATAAREMQLVRGPLWGNSYSFWFTPYFCGAFALPGMGFYTDHIVTSSWFLAVPKGRCCRMTPTCYACGSFSLLCKPICPSFLSSGLLWCPSQELPAGQLYHGNALVPGKVLLCGMAAETLRILHCNRYSKQFRLNIGKIVLPYTGNTSKCCVASLRRCSNPCYAERAD